MIQFLSALLLLTAPAWAADPGKESPFQVSVDRGEIGQDESVSLTMRLNLSTGVQATAPTFSAPDFIVVNQFDGTSMDTVYDSSSRSFKTTIRQSFTRMLRPRRTGKLKISNIRATVNGQVYASNDVTIEVTAGGAATAPPQNYGSQGGLRGAVRRTSGPDVLLRAEVNKDKVYKGEQIIVTYYLYRRVRVGQLEVSKFPELKGFLREEIELPVMNQRLEYERVMLNGSPYDRSVLVRYAAYPLQEGKLRIDPMSVKYIYYPSNGGMDDGEDPFFGFFSQMTPRTGVGRNEPAQIEVMPLPDAGRPANFTGAVGKFNVIATVDRTETKVDEPITLVMKIEGRGNLAAIGEPKVKWPEGIEFYESRGQVKGKQGVGEKIFEIVLIPRRPGPFVLPGVPVGFFDPETKAYRVASSEPIPINVQPGAGGGRTDSTNNVENRPVLPRVASATSQPTADIRGLQDAVKGQLGGEGILAWVYRGALTVAALLLLALALDGLRRLARNKITSSPAAEGRLKRKTLKDLEKLRSLAKKSASLSSQELVSAYEGLSGLLFDALDRHFQVGARALPRSELSQRLVDTGRLKPEVWKQFERVLEYGETLRYASGSGVVSEDRAKKDLAGWVNETEAALRALETKNT